MRVDRKGPFCGQWVGLSKGRALLGGSKARGRRKMKRPADTNQLAKRMVDLAVGEAVEVEPTKRQLNGVASAAKLTPEQRRERAKKAAAARWASH